MTSLPGGTITFLFTDIEGSTKRWEQQPNEMGPALARHDAIAYALAGAIKAESPIQTIRPFEPQHREVRA